MDIRLEPIIIWEGGLDDVIFPMLLYFSLFFNLYTIVKKINLSLSDLVTLNRDIKKIKPPESRYSHNLYAIKTSFSSRKRV